MFHRFKIVLGFFFLGCVHCLPVAFAEVIDRVVANIDGDPVTEEEIREIIAPLLSLREEAVPAGGAPVSVDGANSQPPEPQALTPEIMKEAVILLLFEREAGKMGIKVDPQDVVAYMEQVESSNNAEPGTLLKTLGEQGITLEAYQAKIRSELLRSKVLSAELRSKIQITEEEVDTYLSGDDKGDKVAEKNGDFSLIKVTMLDPKLNDNTRAEAKVKLETARKKILEEKNCAGLSSLGAFCENLGVVYYADLKEDLQQLLREQSEFVPSAIIEDPEPGFYFRGPTSFSRENSRVRDEIKQRLFQEKFQYAAEKYLKEDIFNKYHVEIHAP